MNFHEKIKHGPVYVCSSCHQTWFQENVSKVENISLGSLDKRRFLTQFKSVGNEEWICHTCHASLKNSKVPKLSVANGMVRPNKPIELDLYPLEERLVSLRIHLSCKLENCQEEDNILLKKCCKCASRYPANNQYITQENG